MTTRDKATGFAARGVAGAASSLAGDLAAQMPQWRMSSPEASTFDSIAAVGDSSQAQPGVDVATLRAKFLKGRSPTDAIPPRAARAAATTLAGPVSVEVFKVEPKNGGPSQIAERRNGKISIVSG